MNKFCNKLQQWMQGRYGCDELSWTLTIVSLIILFISCIPELWFLYFAAILLWLWSLIRSCSKNLPKRRAEREAYLRFTGRGKAWFSLKKRIWTDRNVYCYYRCTQCKTVLRVPKGKGKIRIICPKCHRDFNKKT